MIGLDLNFLLEMLILSSTMTTMLNSLRAVDSIVMQIHLSSLMELVVVPEHIVLHLVLVVAGSRILCQAAALKL